MNMIGAKNRWLLTCLAAAIAQALPLIDSSGAAKAQVATSGDVQPAVPPDGGMVAGPIAVGNTGQGTLDLSDEIAVFVDGDIVFGSQAHSKGTGTLGAGTLLYATTVFVGYAGNGAVNLTNGATLVSDGYFGIGNQGGGQGSVTLDGPGTGLIARGNLYIAAGGNGSLNLSGGAYAAAAGNVVIGDQTGAQGVASLSGQGTLLNTGDELWVGYAGNGSLNMADGAAATATSSVLIADQAGSTGTVSLAGAGTALTSGGWLFVGNGGEGQLHLTDGATATAGPSIRIGEVAGSQGQVTLVGPGTSLTSRGTLGIGNFGSGVLDVRDGATVSADGLVGFGTEPGSQGVGMFTGQGSSLTTTGPLAVGTGSSGVLTITEGATVNTDGLGYIGALAEGQGVVTLTGAGSAYRAGAGLYVGYLGTGTLNLADGATATTEGQASLGDQAGSVGTTTLTGKGTTLSTGTGGLRIGNLGNGSLTVANDARLVSSEGVVLAAQAGSRGELAIGGSAGTTPVAPGVVDAPTLAFGQGASQVTFNHSSTDYIFAPALSGNGHIDVLAGTTVFTGDSSAFSGDTAVNGGTLYVNQALGGKLGVQSGATLGGTGSVGTVTVASGGTIAPGGGAPAYQTLAVNGNYHAQAGSLYVAEVNVAQPGQSDHLQVNGTATLDPGSRLGLRFANTAAGFTPGTRYTLLTADQGLSGTYVTTNALPQLSDVLSLQPAYDAQHAYLEVTQTRSLATLGKTSNETATLTAVQSLPATNPVLTTLVNQPSDTAVRQQADGLSGELYASAQTVLIDHSHFLRDAVTGRLRQGEGSAIESGPMSQAYSPAWTTWGQFVGTWGHVGDGNAARVGETLSGILLGMDRQVGEQGRLGVVAGAAHSSLDSMRAARGTGNEVTLGVYGGTLLGAWKLRGGIADTEQRLDVDRRARLLDGSGTTSGRAKTRLGQAFAEVGYPFTVGTATIEPFAQAAYVRLRTDGFQEHGSANALTVRGDSQGSTLTTLGAHASTQWPFQDSALSFHGTLGWRHASGYVDPSNRMRFAAGTDFVVTGTPLSKNAAVVDAGIRIRVRSDVTFDLTYNGQLAGKSKDNAVKGTIALAF
ncbi:MAG: autotransporter domain-containing protein [Burkholderia sp.]